VINGVKVVKLQAWERAFSAHVETARVKELAYKLKVAMLEAANRS
jgi:hypothetical protein